MDSMNGNLFQLGMFIVTVMPNVQGHLNVKVIDNHKVVFLVTVLVNMSKDNLSWLNNPENNANLW